MFQTLKHQLLLTWVGHQTENCHVWKMNWTKYLPSKVNNEQIPLMLNNNRIM